MCKDTIYLEIILFCDARSEFFGMGLRYIGFKALKVESGECVYKNLWSSRNLFVTLLCHSFN